MITNHKLTVNLIASFLVTLTIGSLFANNNKCSGLPTHAQLTAVLKSVVAVGDSSTNGGLANDMWATIVNRDGVVCSVTFSGDNRGDQWLASRVISAQKANTANSLSLPKGSGGIDGLALSTANLYSAVQPGGSLFGLQESNPVDTSIAYSGPSKNYGMPNDPMTGKKIGGVNVFGGGLALYNPEGKVVGALGVSGDTSCTDHIIAWKMRDALALDFVPAGVRPTPDETDEADEADETGGTGDDNIIFDTKEDPSTGHTVSAGGFGHPTCDETATTIGENLPTTHPINKISNK